MTNKINKDIYRPLLAKYCNEIDDCKDCGYPYGPFLPYTMGDYENSKPKIFYMGRDTYGWTEKEKLFLPNGSYDIEGYMCENTKTVGVDAQDAADSCSMFDWGNRYGAFWTFVIRLHLYIRTGIYYPDITEIPTGHRDKLKEIGYANVNAIETGDYIWSGIDPYAHDRIVEAALDLQKIKTLLKAYSPDYIFILCKSWSEDIVFDELDYAKPTIDKKNHLWITSVTHKGKETKIICTNHPRSFGFQQIDPEELVKVLKDYM